MVEPKRQKDDRELTPEDEMLPEDLEIDLEEEDESMRDKIKGLREKLVLCEEEKKKHHEALQRTQADFLNSRRRLEEQLERDRERATDKILTELLTLIDSFDTAMTDQTLWNSIEPRWRVGVEAIHSKLLSILKSNNVVPLDPLGELFNPEEHEAVSNVTVTDEKDVERIISVLQKGFKRNDTIIRPARVVVGTT